MMIYFLNTNPDAIPEVLPNANLDRFAHGKHIYGYIRHIKVHGKLEETFFIGFWWSFGLKRELHRFGIAQLTNNGE